MPWGEFFTWMMQGCIVLVILFIVAGAILEMRSSFFGKEDGSHRSDQDGT